MEIKISGLSKSFGDLEVLKEVSLSLHSRQIYCLMSPSGSGKTTFFRILLGLERADSGVVESTENLKPAAVFQENRLCESFTATDNIAMVMPGSARRNREKARTELLRLLPEESLVRPASTLSGGMKRRTSIVRALSVPSNLVLMDEPFTGLDQEIKQTAIKYIKEKTEGKLVIISTHQQEEVSLLGGTVIHL